MRRDADQLYKALQDADPRGCLHLWGALPLDAPADVYPLQREIVREPVQIDNGDLKAWEGCLTQLEQKFGIETTNKIVAPAS